MPGPLARWWAATSTDKRTVLSRLRALPLRRMLPALLAVLALALLVAHWWARVNDAERVRTRLIAPALAELRAGRVASVMAARHPMPCTAIVGVFSTAADAGLRQLHRAYLARFRSATFAACSGEADMLVRFVLGAPPPLSPALALEQAEHGDLVLLPTVENMNEGKTLAYYSYAVRGLPGAAFVVKADMDTFLHVDNLRAALHRAFGSSGGNSSARLPLVYYGRLIDGLPVPTHGFFMGAVYALSAPLALAVAVAGEAAADERLGGGVRLLTGIEDKVSNTYAAAAVAALGERCAWVDDVHIHDHPGFRSGKDFSAPFTSETVGAHQVKTPARWAVPLLHYFGADALRALLPGCSDAYFGADASMDALNEHLRTCVSRLPA